LNVPIKGAVGVVTHRIGLHRHGSRIPWTTEDSARLRVIGNAIGNFLERKRVEEVLRESEERFRDLANTVPAVLWVCDGEGKQVFCNRYALTVAGQSQEQLAGHGWWELVHADDRERVAATFVAAIRAQSSFSVEFRIRRADQEYRWMLNTAVPRSAGGAYLGHVGIGLDVTDLKRGYEQHLATQHLESLGVLAAGVAHDFNNLLGAIIVRSESARAGLLPGSSVAEDVEQIRLTALRASEIVSQMMTFAGRESAPSTPIDLSALVGEMLDLVKVSISKTAVFKTDLAADLPTIQANPPEIRQWS